VDAYSFDENGLFNGLVKMQVDPLESQRQGRQIHLLPANSTTQKPPFDLAAGERVRWSGSLWIKEPIPELTPDEPRDVTNTTPVPVSSPQAQLGESIESSNSSSEELSPEA
jgi:hypothetical protein